MAKHLVEQRLLADGTEKRIRSVGQLAQIVGFLLILLVQSPVTNNNKAKAWNVSLDIPPAHYHQVAVSPDSSVRISSCKSMSKLSSLSSSRIVALSRSWQSGFKSSETNKYFHLIDGLTSPDGDWTDDGDRALSNDNSRASLKRIRHFYKTNFGEMFILLPFGFGATLL